MLIPVCPCTAKPDGILRAWLDDYLVYQNTKASFRTTGEHLIEKFAFHNFHGGKVRSAPHKG